MVAGFPQTCGRLQVHLEPLELTLKPVLFMSFELTRISKREGRLKHSLLGVRLLILFADDKSHEHEAPDGLGLSRGADRGPLNFENSIRLSGHLRRWVDHPLPVMGCPLV